MIVKLKLIRPMREKFFLAALFIFLGSAVYAQEEAVSDEELERYAVMMDSKD
jgi:hypothetical protein